MSKQYNQYFSARPVISITMQSGKRIRFVGSTYITDKEDEIQFLDNEVRLGHPIIYVKSGQERIDSDAADPLAAVKKKAIEDYLKQQELAADHTRDMGSTEKPGKQGISTSQSIQAITVSSKSK